MMGAAGVLLSLSASTQGAPARVPLRTGSDVREVTA
jgi:hypothetical protein